jgi:prepilin-type N-terminal cleavage/methylation domain-containing protein
MKNIFKNPPPNPLPAGGGIIFGAAPCDPFAKAQSYATDRRSAPLRLAPRSLDEGQGCGEHPNGAYGVIREYGSAAHNAALRQNSQEKRKGFTLIEILVVLGIIALGWLWVPSLLNPPNAQTSVRFEDTLTQITARARMEAIARQLNVGLAISADNTKMCVGYNDTNGNFVKITQLAINPQVVFSISDSSVGGNPGVFTVISASDGFWRVWWFDNEGRPITKGAVLAFLIGNTEKKWGLSDEGALLEN